MVVRLALFQVSPFKKSNAVPWLTALLIASVLGPSGPHSAATVVAVALTVEHLSFRPLRNLEARNVLRRMVPLTVPRHVTSSNVQLIAKVIGPHGLIAQQHVVSKGTKQKPLQSQLRQRMADRSVVVQVVRFPLAMWSSVTACQNRMPVQTTVRAIGPCGAIALRHVAVVSQRKRTSWTKMLRLAVKSVMPLMALKHLCHATPNPVLLTATEPGRLGHNAPLPVGAVCLSDRILCLRVQRLVVLNALLPILRRNKKVVVLRIARWTVSVVGMTGTSTAVRLVVVALTRGLFRL